MSWHHTLKTGHYRRSPTPKEQLRICGRNLWPVGAAGKRAEPLGRIELRKAVQTGAAKRKEDGPAEQSRRTGDCQHHKESRKEGKLRRLDGTDVRVCVGQRGL